MVFALTGFVIANNFTAEAAKEDIAISAAEIGEDWSEAESGLAVIGAWALSGSRRDLDVRETDGEKGFTINLDKKGMTSSSNAVRFDREYYEVTSATVRIYAHFSSGSTYEWGKQDAGWHAYGVYLYGLSRDGKPLVSGAAGFGTGGYCIPEDVTQDSWIDITLTGDDLAWLIDTDGVFRGFKVGSRMDGNASGEEEKFYTDSQAFLSVGKITVTHGDYKKITFDDGNGGTSAKYVAPNGKVAKPTDPVRDNYEFIEWRTENGEAFDFDTEITEDITLTAAYNFTGNYTVTFVSNGGSIINALTVKSGETATKPQDPVKSGYAFGGWATEEGEIFDFATAIEDNITLYAVWKEVAPTEATSVSTAIIAATATDGWNVPQNTLTKIGGWPVSGNKRQLEVKEVDGEKGFTMNLHNKTMTYSTNAVKFERAYKGVSKIVVRAYAHFSSGETYNIGTQAAGWHAFGVYLYGLEKDGSPVVSGAAGLGTGGYCFAEDVTQDSWIDIEIEGDDLKWFIDADGAFKGFKVGCRMDANAGLDNLFYSDFAAFVSVSQITVTHNNYVSVTFDDGENETVKEVVYGSAVEKIADPVREGYALEAWLLNGEVYDFSTSVTSAITLEAKWRSTATCEVTFETDGGTEIPSQTVNKGGNATRPMDPEKLGCDFVGWTDADGNEFDFDGEINEDTVIYAKWKTSPYTRYVATDASKAGENWDEAQSGLTVIGAWKLDGTAKEMEIREIAGLKGYTLNLNNKKMTWSSNAVRFATEYENVESITVRVYAHLSSGSTYSWGSNSGGFYPYGVYLYGLEKDGAPVGSGVSYFGTGGYRFAMDVTQDEWIDLTITGDDLKWFVDADGKFKGFKIGCRMDVNPGVTELFYSNYEAYISVARITVNYGTYMNVTLDYADGTEPVTKKVLRGDRLGEVEDRFREGYSFDGWYTESGEKFDILTEITENMTLTARWTVADTVKVTFDTDGAGEIDYKIILRGSTVEKPESPEKENFEFLGWYLDDELFDFTSAVEDSITLVAKWRDKRSVITDFAAGSYEFADMTLLGVNGTPASAMVSGQHANGVAALNIVSSGTGYLAGEAPALVLYLHSYGMTRTNGLRFKQPVNAKSVGKIIFRVYAHFSTGLTYNTALGGVRLFALGADGLTAGEGYMIPANITQNKWVDLEITGDDLLKLANDDGIIEGFQIGCYVLSNNETGFIEATYGSQKAWLSISEIKVTQKINVTLNVDGETWKTRSAYTGDTLGLEVPVKAGKVFVGWTDISGNSYNADTVLTWDTELFATFKDAAELADGIYYNANETGTRGEGAYIEVVNGKANVSDIANYAKETIYSFGLTTDGELYVYFLSGKLAVIKIGDGGYSLAETVTVRFSTGIESEDFEYEVVAGKKINAPVISRESFRFIRWNLNGSAFDFGTAITESVTLVAVWEYDEVEDELYYANAAGSYYSSEKDAFVELGEDKTVKIGDKTGTYIILGSGVIVVRIEGNADLLLNKLGQTVEYDGAIFVKLADEYYITFVTDGGSEVETIVLSKENGYKATAPAKPVREGYEFLYWAEYNGDEYVKYEFDGKVVTESVNLYARWKRVEKEQPSESGDSGDSSTSSNSSSGGGCGGAIGGGAAVLAAFAMVAAFVLSRKRL